ncbi:toll/interleukin-1 receptor domain-containing protein [Burkholderia glumae]|uniref:toll/interleukin-1 receptor domain-containing protein n=1 Tax=Burkholderia glumae TaxID=337 RepID=UPI00214A4291|nr:toll/interleukin-1 receptor domain-containing protein [Burkholderia glumae]MCR1771121.1 toll/interleukin-1 receptor domain-containing protein [Burkholderia glumae]
MTTNKIPKAFLSYSHDSLDHKKWVLDLAIRLRSNGVESIIDQWSLGPGDDLPHFMEQNLAIADRVLMICTENYVKKANTGAGGVGYEKMIVTADLLRRIDSNKVIPLIRQSGTHTVPTFLQSKLYLDFSRPDQMELAFDDLIRAIHGAPLYVAPPVSNNPFVPVADTPATKTGDGVLIAVRIVVALFEASSSNFISYRDILRKASISRIMLDIYIQEAIDQKLITWLESSKEYLKLENKGKHYAIQHKLIRN